MNPHATTIEYEGTARHGEAWRYFNDYMREQRIVVPGQHSAELWPHFLAGWKAKGKQHDDLRRRR